MPDVGTEYSLERSDPLLNTILPGIGVSIIVNFGDLRAAGSSLSSRTKEAVHADVGPTFPERVSNADARYPAHLDVVVAAVVEAGGFGVGKSGMRRASSMRPPVVR